MADRQADITPATVNKQVSKFLATRLNVLRHVRAHLLMAKIGSRNKLMLKADIVFTVMRSETKFFSMVKTYLP